MLRSNIIPASNYIFGLFIRVYMTVGRIHVSRKNLLLLLYFPTIPILTIFHFMSDNRYVLFFPHTKLGVAQFNSILTLTGVRADPLVKG